MNYYQQFAYFFFFKVKNSLVSNIKIHLGSYVFEMVIDMWSSSVNSYSQNQDAKQTSNAARSAEVESLAFLLRYLLQFFVSRGFSRPIVPGKAWTLTALSLANILYPNCSLSSSTATSSTHTKAPRPQGSKHR
jgi:hypothetical protein